MNDTQRLDWLEKQASRLEDVAIYIENKGGSVRNAIDYLKTGQHEEQDLTAEVTSTSIIRIRENEDSPYCYYLYQEPKIQISLGQLQESGKKIGTTSEEEWDIDIYKFNGEFYTVTYFGNPEDGNINLLTPIQNL